MSYEVPNPYVATTHPYPTRYHGGSWTRPVFTFPYQRSVQSVFKCDDFNDGNPALRGLGTDYNVGRGVFGAGRDGGGVFGPSLYGLGSAGDDIDAIARQILSVGTRSPAAYDIQASFRRWYEAAPLWWDDDDLTTARRFLQEFNAAQGGSAPSATAVTAPRTSAPATTGDAFSTAAVTNLQNVVNAALVKAGYNPIVADGALGPGTCGAIQTYRQLTGNPQAGATYDGVCATKKPWRSPTKKSSGGGGTYPTPAAPVMAEPLQAGLPGGAGTWAMIGGGALAIGLAVVGKKKGWF